jgi:hypothetical protein
MIHPSTMAGPNWLGSSFGTTNPFQQNLSPFRSTPFQGSTFGPGTIPFQTQPFGFGPQSWPIQNTINEITRQVLPTLLANYGISPSLLTNTLAFQTPFGPQAQFGLQSAFGFPQTPGITPFTPFQNGFGDFQNVLQNPTIVAELARQSANMALQTIGQQFPGQIFQNAFGQPITGFGTLTGLGTPFTTLGTSPFGTQGLFGIQPQQQFLSALAQCCQAAASCVGQCLVQFCQSQGIQVNPTLVAQCCQTVATCVAQCLTQLAQGQSTPLNTNLNSTAQFGVSPGVPAGAGAF